MQPQNLNEKIVENTLDKTEEGNLNATLERNKRWGCLLRFDLEINGERDLWLFTWREEDPSTRKILEGGSS